MEYYGVAANTKPDGRGEVLYNHLEGEWIDLNQNWEAGDDVMIQSQEASDAVLAGITETRGLQNIHIERRRVTTMSIAGTDSYIGPEEEDK